MFVNFLQIRFHICVLVLILISSSFLIAQKKIVGYYSQGLTSNLTVANFEFSNLTHINHAFILLSENGDIIIPNNMIDPTLISAVHKAGKKILIAIGGWDQSQNFAVVAGDSLLRQKFINNLTDFVKSNGYDGIDIDWEFPADFKQGQDLTKLIHGIRLSFNAISPDLLISIAVTPSDWIGKYFEYDKLVNFTDWFNLMSYNFHGTWTNHSGHNAPLFSPATDYDGSVEEGLKYLYLTRKVPKNKIMTGIPFYGKEFNSSGLYKVQSGEVLDLIYSDINKFIISGQWEYYWDDVSKVPYLLNREHSKFVTFDDTMSIRLKSEYVLKNDFAGIMIWALGQDIVAGRQQLLETIGQTLASYQTSVNTNEKAIISNYKLFDNHPNPFNSSTVISFNSGKSGKIKLIVYNILGQKIRDLLDTEMSEGIHEIKFEAFDLPSGIYFCYLLSGEFSAVKKMLLEK